jgi:hypothetical protein
LFIKEFYKKYGKEFTDEVVASDFKIAIGNIALHIAA